MRRGHPWRERDHRAQVASAQEFATDAFAGPVRPGADPAGVGLGPVLEWWESHADERLTLADVAARAGLSVRTLNRRFHEQTGRTPMQWVTAVRIRRAQELLERTDHGVDRIAHLVGFASPAHFRVQFKRLSGVSPQAYRRTFVAALVPS